MKLAVLLLTTFGVGCATAAGGADDTDAGPERPSRADASGDTGSEVDAAVADAALPDATPVVLPDATPACTDMWIELLKNPSFESGKSSWPESTPATCTGGVVCPLVQQFGAGQEITFAAQTPTWAVWLGGYAQANDLISQANLDVPDDAKQLRVSGYACVESAETTANVDTLELRLRKGTTVVETPVKLSGEKFTATCTWKTFTAMATASHAGEILELQVNARTNNDTQNTNFFVDTLSVAALVCR